MEINFLLNTLIQESRLPMDSIYHEMARLEDHSSKDLPEEDLFKMRLSLQGLDALIGSVSSMADRLINNEESQEIDEDLSCKCDGLEDIIKSLKKGLQYHLESIGTFVDILLFDENVSLEDIDTHISSDLRQARVIACAIDTLKKLQREKAEYSVS